MPRYDKFLGINNVDAPERLKNDSEGMELREAVNVDIDGALRVRRREGYTKVYAGVNTHSLWSNGKVILFVEDGTLKEFDPETNQATAIRTSMTRFGKVAYQDIFGDVYFTDGNQTGVYTKDKVDTVMGIPTPPTTPTLMSGSGILPAGWYGVAFTAVDTTGRESGSTQEEFIKLDAGSSIIVYGIPASVIGAEKIAVYVTSPNGDVFYRYAEVSTGTVDVQVTSIPSGAQLRTRYMTTMPAGHLLTYHQQRLYVAVNNVVYYSEPFQYGLTRVTRNFLQFPSKITLMVSTDDGMYIADEDHTYYVNGRNPEEFAITTVADYGAVEGTAVEIPRDYFGEGKGSRAWMWVTREGVCGGVGGEFTNLTKGRYAVPESLSGTAAFRLNEGVAQFVSILQAGDGTRSNMYTSDVAVAEVVRNGIVIT